MKKFLKTTTALAFAALVATSSLGVSAKTTYLDYNLKKAYNVTNYAGTMNLFYDYGTSNWYDDVRASTRVKSTAGLSVTSKTILYTEDDSKDVSELNQKNVEGWVDSGEASVPGKDYAKEIKHEMYRKIIGQTQVESLIYDIT